jgi:hypothetical protein
MTARLHDRMTARPCRRPMPKEGDWRGATGVGQRAQGLELRAQGKNADRRAQGKRQKINVLRVYRFELAEYQVFLMPGVGFFISN